MYVIGKASTIALAADRDLGDQRVVAAGFQRGAVARGDQPDGLLADVVAGAGVLLAGVAEPDDEQSNVEHRRGGSAPRPGPRRRQSPSAAGLGALGLALDRSGIGVGLHARWRA